VDVGAEPISLYVTVILPWYNEEGHVIAEVERITRAMDDSGYSYELLAIDDGSTDGTLARGEIVVWTDADMTYPNERIPELVRVLEKDPMVDQVVGARTSERGTYKVLRVPAKWFIRKFAERLTGVRIPDLNSGLRAFRREVALAFLSNNHEVQYVPIEYSTRAGKSKFRFVSDVYKYVLQILRMTMYFNPLKVLMPLALLGDLVVRSRPDA
jgi:glycosyltransferase involved in cell wall biosynthesis